MEVQCVWCSYATLHSVERKMKVGILTLHNAINYGATLQALALQQYIDSLGVDVEIIDYRNKHIDDKYWRSENYLYPIKIILKGHIRSGIQELKETIVNRNQYSRFRKKYLYYIKQNMKLSKPYTGQLLKDENPYSIIIVGSDQVWNTKITGNDNVYFLKNISNLKKISYAASGLEDGENQNLIDLISQFDVISVRERSALKKFSETQRNLVKIVCDPTMLYPGEFWKKRTGNRRIACKYIFVYSIWKNPELVVLVNNMAKFYNLKVVWLTGVERIVKVGKKRYSSVNPDDFLNFISYADKVVINSFHGTVFSILFKKDFFAFNSGNRVNDLLTTLDICHRGFIQSDIDFEKIEKINWEHVDIKLAELRKSGREFLIESLGLKDELLNK